MAGTKREYIDEYSDHLSPVVIDVLIGQKPDVTSRQDVHLLHPDATATLWQSACGWGPIQHPDTKGIHEWLTNDPEKVTCDKCKGLA